ncbi:unnamed protein product [Mycena citricolor]|uniref:Protein ARV n=1 Tax=Mycena citricolor TaxID=2018698 RepID=A0AAD2JYU2_9AGAR|nr:unnamed protein product [Mycena citricolor]
MPICTTCTAAVPFLYTVYDSKSNLRLHQCEKCHSFADPYVEHDSFILLLDLILLKRDVFRHLLYNRGTNPRKYVDGVEVNVERPTSQQRERNRWKNVFRFGGPLIFVDAFIRWSHLHPSFSTVSAPLTDAAVIALLKTVAGVLIETITFHSGVICACWAVQSLLDRLPFTRHDKPSAIRQEFRFSLIPLTLFYSSLTKLFLLFLLTIWRPSTEPTRSSGSLAARLGWQQLSDEDVDREWVVRNVLGGMSAGFGLRVILDSHPIFTTLIIAAGWVVKTAASRGPPSSSFCTMSNTDTQLPPRFADLKREIASANPNFEQNLTRAWGELLVELEKATSDIAAQGSSYIPQVHFADLDKLTAEQIADIKRKGTVVIRDVVDDDKARGWKTSLEEFVKANPQVEGWPETGAKQFFQLYWTKAQIEARAHPNMLKSIAWLNNLYHTNGSSPPEGVDLSTPLAYADRFRIRNPGGVWDRHPPHVDGGSIERWEDEKLRVCFADILSGAWRNHDPYALEPRLEARTSLYNRPNQSSVFRTFQGWLAISKTGPHQGTLKVFPSLILSNAYIIMRPFFRPIVPLGSPDILAAKNWVFDLSSSEFPGIFTRAGDKGFHGPRPSDELHPHLLLNQTMTSIPDVNPGDTVFWHCDVVHAVEEEHTGAEDSAVMYIPAVPLTPVNASYIEKQRVSFAAGIPPPDYPVATTGVDFVGLATEADIVESEGRRAMGLPIALGA